MQVSGGPLHIHLRPAPELASRVPFSCEADLAYKRNSMRVVTIRGTRSYGCLLRLAFTIALAVGWDGLAQEAHGQTQQPPAVSAPAPATSAAPVDRPIQERLAILERETANNKQRLDDTFNILVGLGGLATLGLLLFAFLSWFRDHRQQQDYRREWEFYKERERQERRDSRLERNLHERRAGRQARLEDARTAQDVQLGAKSLESFDKMTAAQISNIEGLGKVIGLVRDASQIRLDREKHQEELEQLIASIKNDAEQKYQQAEEDSLRFTTVPALRWPTLPEERRRVASSACRVFEQVPDFVLAERKKRTPHEHARLLHFVGIFAYYADHNVDAALRYLTAANGLFGDTVPKEFRNNQAYTRHFLGVLQKNWPLRNEPPGTSLKEAQKFLQMAEAFLTMESGQFLTALTHAEVLSYRFEDRKAARAKLDEMVNRIKGLQAESRSNASQDELLPRAYLLRGNVNFVSGENESALGDFSLARSLSPKNPYVLFSLAQTKRSDPAALELWQQGLESLPRPPALEKPETVTRVLIFAWGMIAAHHAGFTDLFREYKTAFETIGSGIEREGKHSARFFSPLTKELVDFDALQTQISDHVNGHPHARET